MKKQDFKNKHDHKLTDWLKVIIFSILMMAPFFSIATRCLYVINNKNAKDSYYGNTINQEIYNEKNVDSLEIGKRYSLISESFTSQSGSYIFMNVSNFKNNLTDIEDDSVYELRIFYTSTYIVRCIRGSDNNFDLNLNTLVNISFDYLGKTASLNQSIFDFFYSIQYNNYSFLDNAFDYSISQLQQSPTFNWTTQTATYDVFNNMLDGLTIQNGILPLLLTYWMMLIVVYIIVDIIIKTFTFITHLISQ